MRDFAFFLAGLIFGQICFILILALLHRKENE